MSKFGKSIVLFVFLISLLAACSGGSDKTPSETQQPQTQMSTPVMKTGDKWIMKGKSMGDEIMYTYEITGEETIDGKACYVVDIKYKPPLHDFLRDGEIRLDKQSLDIINSHLSGKNEDAKDVEMNTDNSYARDIDVYPLEVGKTWQETVIKVQTDNLSGKYSTQTITEIFYYKVDSMETITVPAGTFNCYKILKTDPDNYLVETIWRSAKTKWADVKVIDYSYVGNNRELYSYTWAAEGQDATPTETTTTPEQTTTPTEIEIPNPTPTRSVQTGDSGIKRIAQVVPDYTEMIIFEVESPEVDLYTVCEWSSSSMITFIQTATIEEDGVQTAIIAEGGMNSDEAAIALGLTPKEQFEYNGITIREYDATYDGDAGFWFLFILGSNTPMAADINNFHVFADNESDMKDFIDSIQGKSPSLYDTEEFKDAFDKLPQETWSVFTRNPEGPVKDLLFTAFSRQDVGNDKIIVTLVAKFANEEATEEGFWQIVDNSKMLQTVIKDNALNMVSLDGDLLFINTSEIDSALFEDF